MLRRARSRTVPAALGLVLVLLGVAALGARSVPGTGRRAPVRLQIDAGRLFSIGFWVLAVSTGLILMWAVWSSGIRILPRSRPQRRWVRVLLTVVVVTAVMLVLARFRPDLTGPPGPTVVPPPEEVTGPGSRAAVWVLAVLLGVAATGIMLAVRRPRRNEPAAPGAATPAAFAPANSRYDEPAAATGYRGSIIGAYVRMEGLFAGRGAERGRAEAPREYLDRTTHRFGATGTSAAVLTGLFEFARFSDRPVDQTMQTVAGDALREVQRTLEQP